MIPVEEANSYTLELENFADAIEGQGTRCSAARTRSAQARVIDALYRSADTRTAVDL